jgi:hypothetical protein
LLRDCLPRANSSQKNNGIAVIGPPFCGFGPKMTFVEHDQSGDRLRLAQAAVALRGPAG